MCLNATTQGNIHRNIRIKTKQNEIFLNRAYKNYQVGQYYIVAPYSKCILKDIAHLGAPILISDNAKNEEKQMSASRKQKNM